MGCANIKSNTVKESVKQAVKSKRPTLLNASEHQGKPNHLRPSYNVVVQSVDGGTLVGVELDQFAIVGDILQQLGKEGHHRVCTLLFSFIPVRTSEGHYDSVHVEERHLHPTSHIAPCGHEWGIGLSTNATNYVKAMFWSADGLKEIGFDAQSLIHESRQPDLIAAMCNGQKRSDYRLKPAGYTVRELKETGFSAQELKQCRCHLSDLLAAGFTADECNAAGYDVELFFGSSKQGYDA